MITALQWIPRGVTPRHLKPAEDTEQMVDMYLSVIEGNKKPEPEPEPHPISAEDAEIIAKYDLEHYDDETEQQPYVEHDEYMVPRTKHDEEEDDEDDAIRATDNLLIVGKSIDPDSSLEIHIFDNEEKSFYPHHEIMIPSFPLSLAWIDASPETATPGSFVAVSSMLHHIEIWDLNVAESTIPCAWLQHHTDSVTSLSWNPLQKRALLSTSVDGTAAIWHLDALRIAGFYNLGQPRPAGQPYAQGKSIQWNPKQASIFGCGTNEGVFGYDARSSDITWSALPGESIDTFAWLNNDQQFVSSTEPGELYWFDTRNPETPVQVIQGHDDSVTSISVARYQPRQIVATTDMTGSCIIWDLTNGTAVQNQRSNMGMGELFACQFCPEIDLLLAVGGSTAETRIWDVMADLDQEIDANADGGEPPEVEDDDDE